MKKIGNYVPFLLTKFETKFLSHSKSKADSKSLLANINHTDHPSYVLFPIMCTSTVDSYDIFIYNLMSEYIKK